VSAAAVLVLALGGCMVTPATGPGSYRGKATRSLDDALSELHTARITVETLTRGRIFGTSADEIVSATEEALGSIADTFGAVQPPRESDQVHDATADALAKAGDAAEAARIAVRRRDPAELRSALDDLKDAIEAVDEAGRKVEKQSA
jgi:hypothetical protein